MAWQIFLTETLASIRRTLLAPAAILLVTALVVMTGASLPASLAGLRVLGPAMLLVAGSALSLWFNRGRAFIALASLLVGYAAYSIALEFGADSFAARAVYTGLVLLVPLNVLLGLLFSERGVFHHFNYRWPMLAAAELIGVAWIASSGRSSLSGTAWQGLLDHWLLRSPPLPLAGRFMIAAAFVAAVVRAWPRHTPLDVGLVGAMIAFFIGCEWNTSPGAFDAFAAAAGTILLVSLLQESQRLAFRDELTGLPGRRALQESLTGLGPTFAIGMVDIDHFKHFNDTHGHDVGDQVLKLVAARLAKVEGGGTAYRYGGEEFAVLFAGSSAGESVPHMERLRAAIQGYHMTIRGDNRPKDPDTGSKLRTPGESSRAPDKVLSVTVSMGVAERSDAHATPAAVMRAADEALYRAKRAGRNRVSR
jgi:GGDEF domain-containing protein